MKVTIHKKLLVKEIYAQLLILFLARKGFFTKDKEGKCESLWEVIFRYLLFSLLFSIVFLALASNPMIIYKDFPIIKESYFLYLFVSLLIIMVVGIFYEDFYFFKTNTDKTLKVFFGFSDVKVIIIAILKNFIITSPLFVLLSGLNSLYINKRLCPIIIIFLVMSFTSYGLNYLIYNTSIGLSKNKRYKKNFYIKKLDIYSSYYLSIIPFKFLCTNIGVSIVSILLLFIAQKIGGQLNFFISNENNKYFFTTLFISTMIFTGKNVSLGVVLLNKDIDYIKTLTANIHFYFWSLFIVGYIVILIPVGLFYVSFLVYIKATVTNIIYAMIAIILSYTIITLIQFYQGLKIKDIKFKNYYNFLNYKLPISVKIYQIIFSITCLLANIFYNKFSSIYVFILCLLFLILMTFFTVKQINKLIKEY